MGRGQTSNNIKQTDIATTRWNRPSGPIRWKQLWDGLASTSRGFTYTQLSTVISGDLLVTDQNTCFTKRQPDTLNGSHPQARGSASSLGQNTDQPAGTHRSLLAIICGTIPGVRWSHCSYHDLDWEQFMCKLFLLSAETTQLLWLGPNKTHLNVIMIFIVYYSSSLWFTSRSFLGDTDQQINIHPRVRYIPLSRLI